MYVRYEGAMNEFSKGCFGMHWLKREKWLSVLVFIAVVVAIWAVYTRQQAVDSADVVFTNELPAEETVNIPQETPEENEPDEIVIDVKGAVHKPGVYTMQEGDRVIDAVEKAGGVTDQADENRINLATLVKDEMVVYVPKKGEETNPQQVMPFQADAEEEGKVAINSASSDVLQQLQGIGPAKAEAIIAYREEHGPFQSVEDLLNVSGIGEKSLEKIKNDIIID